MLPSVNFTSLPFDEAINYYQQKVKLPTATWKDLWQGMHARAFVVAGATKNELLCDLYNAIEKGITRGTTLNEFRRDFDKIVQKNGWSYKGGRGWRTAVMFNTNVSTAYSAGHYKQMTDPAVLDARPYWRYVPSTAIEQRPEHMQWYNLVLPAASPFWETHYPPNGWGCKCGVTSHSAREIDRLKSEFAGSNNPIKTTAPADEYYEWTDKATGKTHMMIPKGIDPGWDYNVGEAAWGRTEALRLMEDQGPWVDFSLGDPEQYGRGNVPVDSASAELGNPVKRGDVDALRKSLRNAIGGDEVALVDPTGETTMITQAIVDHIVEKPQSRWDGREAYFPLIPELISDPYEIWISFARSEISGRTGIRKKYVKEIRIDKNRIIGLYAEIMNGQWVSGNFFRGQISGAKNLRKGRLLYARE